MSHAFDRADESFEAQLEYYLNPDNFIARDIPVECAECEFGRAPGATLSIREIMSTPERQVPGQLTPTYLIMNMLSMKYMVIGHQKRRALCYYYVPLVRLAQKDSGVRRRFEDLMRQRFYGISSLSGQVVLQGTKSVVPDWLKEYLDSAHVEKSHAPLVVATSSSHDVDTRSRSRFANIDVMRKLEIVEAKLDTLLKIVASK